MGELGPTSEAGGPGLLEAFEAVLHIDSKDRALAIRLMKQHSLVDAIDLATAALRRTGRAEDAEHLFNSTIAFKTWDPTHLKELEEVGLDVLEKGLNPSFTHSIGPWRIEHLGDGEIRVQAPAENLCQGDDAPSDDPGTSPGDDTGTSSGDA